MAIVASECDIIESFARHTLSFADHLHVLLHNSYDSTRRILECLAGEGLPISFDVAATAVYSRGRMGDDLVHQLAASGRYDYVLPLDADEFIVAGSRTEVEEELSRVPAGGTLSLGWLTYVPTEHDDAADPNPVTRIRHRLRSPHAKYRKVFFAADLLAREDVYLTDGNHKLLSRTGREIPERAASRVSLAHYPIRGAQQLMSKAFIGSMARRLSPDYTDDRSRHWRLFTHDPSLTTDTPVKLLSGIAMRYLDSKDTELIDAPLDTRARSLKYADLIRVNAFERLSAFVAAAFAERVPGVPSGLVDEASRQGLLKELEDARHAMQRLHEEIRAVKQDARRRVRAAKRKARILAVSAIGAIVFIAAAMVAYAWVR